MIWTALLTARSFLAKIPWQVWLVLAVLVSAWVWGNHRFDQGYATRSDEYAAAAAEAERKARKADAAATDTANAGKASSAAEIERGREAAEDAPDPWKAATEAMR